MTAEIAISRLQRLQIEVEHTFGVENAVHEMADTTDLVTAPAATDLNSSIVALNELKADYNLHRVEAGVHEHDDTDHAVTSADATDLASAETLANEIKVDYNLHGADAAVHRDADVTDVITSPNASDLSSLVTLCTELTTDYNAHCSLTSQHDWVDVHASDIELTREQQVHRRMERTQRLTQRQGNIHGRRSCSLRFGHALQGDGVALDAEANPVDDSLQTLLNACLGGGYAAAGSTVLGGDATTTVIPVQEGHGVRFRAGTAVMVEGTGPGGRNEISWIEGVAADDITLAIALTAPPADGGAVWNSHTSYLDPAATTTLQSLLTGEAVADTFLVLGLAGGLTLEGLLQLEAPARALFELAGVRWETGVDTLAAGTYDGADPLGTGEDVEIHWQDHGASARSLLNCSALEIVPGVTWTQLMARGSEDREHVSRVRITRAEPTASFTADVDADFLADFTVQTEKMLLLANGRTPGSSWAVCLPRCRINAVPPRGEHGEQTASQVSIEALENDAGDASTALMRSPIFISRL